MKLAACEAPATMLAGDTGWKKLVDAVSAENPDIFLLNELPFGDWVSVGEEPDRKTLEKSQRVHKEGLQHLADFGVPSVLGSFPTFQASRSVNCAFTWSSSAGLKEIHTKQFFPNEGGFYEARWFERGERKFELGDAAGFRIGFLICTDVMFNEWARHYGRDGAHLIAVPRATPVGSESRWKTMCQAAAIVSGCYVASSNRAGLDDSGLEFAGKGWIVDPTGEVITETSAETPIAVADLDLSMVKRCQNEYPCYVEELG